MTRAAYAVGQFRDAEAELARLLKQAAVVAEAEECAFRELGLPDEGRVLDMGCGPGFVGTRIRASRPKLTLLGLDIDPAVLERARATLPVVRASVVALPFGAGTFDAAYARLVLRHLADPAAAIAEAVRVLCAGGCFLAADSDDDTLVMHPVPDGFAEVLRARQETFRRRGADPFIGRRLTSLLRSAGLDDVRAVPVPISTATIGPEAFASIVLAPIADGIDPDVMAPDEVARGAEALRDWGRRDDVFGLMTAVIASGRRPE